MCRFFTPLRNLAPVLHGEGKVPVKMRYPMQQVVPVAQSQQGAASIHVLFGTQTGTTEMVASDIEDALAAKGFAVSAPRGLDEVTMAELSGLGTVLIVCSSYGDGWFPDAAVDFYEALTAPDAPDLTGLSFAVLGFGDSGYDDFCAAGRLLDEALAARGALRIHPRGSCDIVYEQAAETWTEGVLSVLQTRRAEGAVAAVAVAAPVVLREKGERPKWTRAHPYAARLVENRLLSDPASDKEIRHFRIELGEDGPDYEVGDALNILPENDPALVEAWLDRSGVAPATVLPGHDRPFADMLRDGLEIVAPSRELLVLMAKRAAGGTLGRLMAQGDRVGLEAWLWGRDALDLLTEVPEVTLSPEELVSVLRPLQHRSYSIASSARVLPHAVDLTVSVVRFDRNGRDHGGVCSTYLAGRLPVGGAVNVFVTPNSAFRVPSDPAVPMIMVGPGAGIAPFIGFLQERAAVGATGSNWLFFGDRRRAHDFIYRAELEAWQQQGVLTRLDLAFSRDGAEKVYVQDRMRVAGADLFAALEAGGHFYVCGDAQRMAPDVEAALLEVIAEHGGLDAAGAQEYLARLRRERRYLRDVY